MRLYNSPPESTYGFRECCKAVRAAVPIEKIARQYTELEPFGSGGWFTGCCPLPDRPDDPNSFYIFPPGRWWCYGCGRGGEVVDLEFHFGGYKELSDAMVALATAYGVELPHPPRESRRWEEKKRDIRTAAEKTREVVRLERQFKVLVLSQPEFEIEDAEERRAAIKRAWQVWESEMRRIS